MAFSTFANRPRGELGGSRLPEDVWLEIFKMARPSISMESPVYTAPFKDQVPWSLTQTCRHWREVARGSPLLWDRVQFKVKCDPTLEVSPRIELLEDNILLSRNVPLHVYGFGGYDSKDAPILKKLFDMIFSTILRWKHAHLSLPDVSFDRLAAYDLGAGVIQLRTLVLETLNVTESGTQTPATHYLPSQLWSRAPHLERLAINLSLDTVNGHNTNLNWKNTLLTHTPFNQLTFLEIGAVRDESITIPELYKILTACTSNLVTGRFPAIETSSWPDNMNDGSVPPITMHRLECLLLGLSALDADNVSTTRFVTTLTSVLDCFVRAPRLVSLALHHDAFTDVQFLRDFIIHSQCQGFLEELDLYDSSMLGDLADLLEFVPALKSLHRGLFYPKEFLTGIDDAGRDVGHNLFSKLARWNDQSSEFLFCPRLEEITVDYYSALGSSVESAVSFKTMIEKRVQIPRFSNVERRFRSLRLTRVESANGESYPKIEALKRLCQEPFNLSLQVTSMSSYTNRRYIYARSRGFYTEGGDDGDGEE